MLAAAAAAAAVNPTLSPPHGPPPSPTLAPDASMPLPKPFPDDLPKELEGFILRDVIGPPAVVTTLALPSPCGLPSHPCACKERDLMRSCSLLCLIWAAAAAAPPNLAAEVSCSPLLPCPPWTLSNDPVATRLSDESFRPKRPTMLCHRPS